MSRILFFQLSPRILASAVLASGLTVSNDKKPSTQQQQQPLTPTTKTKNNDQRPVTLLSYSEDGTVNINVTGFKSIMEKVKDLPVVVYSINGRRKTGKSYLFNYFVQFLNHEVDPSLPSPNKSSQWFTPNPNELTFKWTKEDDPRTEGIQIWSEPFVVTRNGKKVAVILLDCQGLYDISWRGAEKYQNVTIIIISYILSSTCVFNVKHQIDRQLLRHITRCSEYVRMQYEDYRDIDQHLLFLLRDWENSRDEKFSCGYHPKQVVKIVEGIDPRMQEKRCIDPANYRNHFFNFARYEIPHVLHAKMLKFFEHVTMYLMPGPGKAFLDDSSRSPPSEDFQEHLKQFIYLLNSDELALPKKCMGEVMTGKTMQRLLEFIATKFTVFYGLPPIEEFHEQLFQFLAVADVMDWVNETGENWKKKNPHGVSDEKINDFIVTIKSEAKERFEKGMLVEGKEDMQKYFVEMEKRFKDINERLKTQNKNNKN